MLQLPISGSTRALSCGSGHAENVPERLKIGNRFPFLTFIKCDFCGYVRKFLRGYGKFYAVTITDLRSYEAQKAMKKDVTKVA